MVSVWLWSRLRIDIVRQTDLLSSGEDHTLAESLRAGDCDWLLFTFTAEVRLAGILVHHGQHQNLDVDIQCSGLLREINLVEDEARGEL